MNFENTFPSLLFWASFTLSAGPFWITVASSAKSTAISQLFRHFLIYLVVGWLPLIILIAAMVKTVGKFHQGIYNSLYFVGGSVILYLAYKTFKSAASNGASFVFTWKAMTLLSWANPKVWLTIPAGALTATYVQSDMHNTILFFLVGMPLYFLGFFMWANIGKYGAKIAKDKFNLFNAVLLLAYAVYLLYEGYLAVTA